MSTVLAVYSDLGACQRLMRYCVHGFRNPLFLNERFQFSMRALVRCRDPVKGDSLHGKPSTNNEHDNRTGDN